MMISRMCIVETARLVSNGDALAIVILLIYFKPTILQPFFPGIGTLFMRTRRHSGSNAPIQVISRTYTILSCRPDN